MKKLLKQILLWATLIMGALFGCSIDAAFDGATIPVIIALSFTVLVVLCLLFLRKRDIEEILHDPKITE